MPYKKNNDDDKNNSNNKITKWKKWKWNAFKNKLYVHAITSKYELSGKARVANVKEKNRKGRLKNYIIKYYRNILKGICISVVGFSYLFFELQKNR